MARTKTLPPRIDPIRLPELTDAHLEELRAHDSRELERYRGIDIGGRDLAGASFMETEFLDVLAHETNFRSASWVDTVFERLNAPVFRAPRSHFRDVTISSSRVGSAEFYEAGWQSVRFSNCKLGYVNLRAAKIRDVLFENCSIEELDLAGVAAHRVAFSGTAIQNLDVTRAQLEHVDLRGVELRGIVGLEDLRGATLDSAQVADLAPLFAEKFGIRVEG